MGLVRGYPFEGNCESGVVSLVRKEWGDTGSTVGGVIVYEFSERKLGCPVVLLVVRMYSQVLFQNLVDPFRLSISFGVVGCGEVGSNIQSLT